MQPHQLSSGDVIADRRADYARMLEEGGEPEAAAELMEQALELVPAWAAGWYRLATYREKAGRGEAAIEAYRKTLALDPDGMALATSSRFCAASLSPALAAIANHL